MKIATYNIQNLFHRHSDLICMNAKLKVEQWNDEFEALLKKQNRKDSDYSRMRDLADLLCLDKASQFAKRDSGSNYSQKTGMITIPLEAIHNKGKVILDSNPDILLLQEVESRSSLLQFNIAIFENKEESEYKEILHLDGNGQHELGMGILLKDGYRVKAIRSFSSERDIDGSFLFTNDLQSYKIETPLGYFVHILCVQLTSDTFEGINESKRTRQAEMVSRVYQELREKGNEIIIVLGSLNAPKYSKSISPILESDMTNVSQLGSFEVELDIGMDSGYHRLGAYRTGVNLRQLDYLLVSPYLVDKVIKSGMNRKAIWPLSKPQWSIYDSMKKETHEASEHPLLWVEINLETNQNQFKLSA